MPNVVYFNTYKLKKGASVPDFLLAVQSVIDEVLSKQKGFISSTFLVDGDTWADHTVFETMDDLNAFLAASQAAHKSGANDAAERFYSFLNLNSCKSHYFSIASSTLSDK